MGIIQIKRIMHISIVQGKSWGVALICLGLFFLSSGCNKEPDMSEPKDDIQFYKGFDASFLPEIREYPISFKDKNGQEKDMLSLLKESGVNLIRLRLWTGETNKHCGEEEVIAFAAECKAFGFKVLLDLHYSDTWADPGNQKIPGQWKALPDAVLLDSVYQYTYRITSIIKPEFIQIGNEINYGLMWPVGKYNNGGMMNKLLKKGCEAARDAKKDIGIVLHYAGMNGCISFFKQRIDAGIDFDIAAFSYYPYWHGTSLATVEATLGAIQLDLGKKAFVAELAYPFTLGWNDYTNNVIGLESQLSPGFPATQEGQYKFIKEINIVSQRSKALGFCYWGGEWVAFKGDKATDGSTWENQALFGFDNTANQGLGAFK